MSETTTTLTPISGAALGGVKRSAKYKALTDLGLSVGRALAILGYTVPAQPSAATAPAKTSLAVPTLVQSKPTPEPAIDPRVQELIAAGFKPKKARKIIAERDAQPATDKTASAARPVVSKSPSQVKAESLVESSGLAYMSGRVSGDYRKLAEALVRVGNSTTGHPEIVRFEGPGRIAAVVIYKDTYGRVVQQQLTTPKES